MRVRGAGLHRFGVNVFEVRGELVDRVLRQIRAADPRVPGDKGFPISICFHVQLLGFTRI